MIVLYIVILVYFNFNITSIVNVFMLSIEKKINTFMIYKFSSFFFLSGFFLSFFCLFFSSDIHLGEIIIKSGDCEKLPGVKIDSKLHF